MKVIVKIQTVILEKSKQKIIEIDLNSDIQKQLNSENDINKKRKIILEYILNNLRGK